MNVSTYNYYTKNTAYIIFRRLHTVLINYLQLDLFALCHQRMQPLLQVANCKCIGMGNGQQSVAIRISQETMHLLHADS